MIDGISFFQETQARAVDFYTSEEIYKKVVRPTEIFSEGCQKWQD